MNRVLLVLLLLAASLLGTLHSAQAALAVTSGESGSSRLDQATAGHYLHSAELSPLLPLCSEELSDDLHDAENFVLLPALPSGLFVTAENNHAQSLLFSHYAIRAPPQV